MKISIIIPIYKIEQYLKSCVDSVLSQSYKDYELILVDDGSPDNCGKICDEYAKNNDNIKVVHKKNGGLSSARNAGMEVAEGEFLFFLDGDDFLEENSLEKFMKSVEENEADMYTFASYDYHENGEKKLIPNISDKFIYSVNDFYKEMIKVVGYFRWEVWRYLYKKSIVDENNIKARTDAKITEDCDFTNRYLQKIKKIYSVNIPVVNYRYLRPGSAMTEKEKNKCLDEIRNGKEFFELYSKQEGMNDVVDYFEYYYYSKLKRLLLQFDLNKEDEEVLRKYKIKPRNYYGKIIEIFIRILGHIRLSKIMKIVKKYKK